MCTIVDLSRKARREVRGARLASERFSMVSDGTVRVLKKAVVCPASGLATPRMSEPLRLGSVLKAGEPLPEELVDWDFRGAPDGRRRLLGLVDGSRRKMRARLGSGWIHCYAADAELDFKDEPGRVVLDGFVPKGAEWCRGEFGEVCAREVFVKGSAANYRRALRALLRLDSRRLSEAAERLLSEADPDFGEAAEAALVGFLSGTRRFPDGAMMETAVPLCRLSVFQDGGRARLRIEAVRPDGWSFSDGASFLAECRERLFDGGVVLDGCVKASKGAFLALVGAASEFSAAERKRGTWTSRSDAFFRTADGAPANER